MGSKPIQTNAPYSLNLKAYTLSPMPDLRFALLACRVARLDEPAIALATAGIHSQHS